MRIACAKSFTCAIYNTHVVLLTKRTEVCVISWFNSQEKEDWLDALETGELDDFGQVKHEKDTSTMTA